MYAFEILKFLDKKIFMGRGVIGKEIKEKTLRMAEKLIKEALSTYLSARSQMEQRLSADDLDVFDGVMTSRFIALASVCLESDLPLLDKNYLESILQFYIFINNDNLESHDSSEFLKQMYYAKLEKAELREEIMDDINFMIEIYEGAEKKVI